MDGWLRAGQPGLFSRILPFHGVAQLRLFPAPRSSRVWPREAACASANCSSRRSRIAKLDADAQIDGRKIVLRRAQADFYGGRLSGELNALLTADPFYSFRGRIDRVDLAPMTNASAPLAGRFAGLAAGELNFEAHGIGREPLAASLAGEGVLRIRNAVLRGIDLGADLGSDEARNKAQAKSC